MELSVIVPTYNRKDKIVNCIRLLASQGYPKEKYEILVVDDGGEDGTDLAVIGLKDHIVNLEYIRLAENSGPAAARNLGIEESRGDIIAFIDDDAVVDKDWVEKIILAHEDQSDLIIIGALKSADKSGVSAGFWELGIHRYVEKMAYRDNGKTYLDLFSPMNTSCKRGFFEIVGVFDTSLRTGEDRDMLYRCLEEGIKIRYVPEIVAWHDTRKNIISLIRQRFIWGVNMPYITRKWASSDAYQGHMRTLEKKGVFNTRPCDLRLSPRNLKLFILWLAIRSTAFISVRYGRLRAWRRGL